MGLFDKDARHHRDIILSGEGLKADELHRRDGFVDDDSELGYFLYFQAISTCLFALTISYQWAWVNPHWPVLPLRATELVS